MHLKFSAVIYHISKPKVLGSVGGWEGSIKLHMLWLDVLVSVGQTPAPGWEQIGSEDCISPSPVEREPQLLWSSSNTFNCLFVPISVPITLTLVSVSFDGIVLNFLIFPSGEVFQYHCKVLCPFFICCVLFKMEFIIIKLVLEVKKCNKFQKLVFNCSYSINGTCSKFPCRQVVKRMIPSYSCWYCFPFIATVF